MELSKEEIIRMKMEALAGTCPLIVPFQSQKAFDEYLERFAALVAAHAAAAEREACAKVCEERYMGDNNREDMEARRCAAAIRARGKK